jgi:hypothetical protein
MTYSVGQKIRELYKNKKNIDYRNSAKATQQTIKILASGGIGSALIYTGTSRNITNINGILAFNPNTEKRIYAVVYVDGMDEYNIDYVQIFNDRAEYISRHPGIFVGELARVYETIYDRYIVEHQDGFIKC